MTKLLIPALLAVCLLMANGLLAGAGAVEMGEIEIGGSQ